MFLFSSLELTSVHLEFCGIFISLHEFSSFIGIILTCVAWGVKVGMEKMSLYLHPLLTLCSLEEDAAWLKSDILDSKAIRWIGCWI